MITWRHPMGLAAAVLLALLVGASLFAFLSPFDPNQLAFAQRWSGPSLTHPFGQDELGRDLFTRVLYGGRVSLLVGCLAMSTALVIGTAVGALAGYFGGWVDAVLMRMTDVFLIFPQIFVLLLLSFLLRQAGVAWFVGGIGNIVLVIGVTSWMIVARLVRSSFLHLREADFVLAARAYGAGHAHLIVRHMLPAALGPVVVAATRGVAEAILTESALSFLGYGVQPPTATWGNILGEAMSTIGVYPWLTLFPGAMIFLTVLALNYLGDALRDTLDPRSAVAAGGP